MCAMITSDDAACKRGTSFSASLTASLLIAGFKTDRFAGAVYLITEVVNAVRFLLIDGTDLQLDFLNSHIFFHD